MFQLPAVDLKNAWPLDYDFLFDWNVKNLINNGDFGKFVFVWGIALSLIIIPLLVYFYGKRWYCSWVCGCGGLAETLGDPYRQHSSKKMIAWKFERYIIHGVLVFAVLMTVWTGCHHREIYSPELDYNSKTTLLGISSGSIRGWYGFLIGSIFAGVIGTGFYPIFATGYGADLDVRLLHIWALFSGSSPGSELLPTEDNAFPVEIVLRTANKGLTYEHMRKKDRILCVPLV